MIASTRRWFRRNRTNFAVGIGVLSVGYAAGQYALAKISETRQRMGEDRIAKENLRRRFQQNQEDCTITVLALLPTATEALLEALPVEKITQDLQRKKAERLGKSVYTLETGASEQSSRPPSTTDEDSKSLASLQGGSYVQASQMVASGSSSGDADAQRPLKSRSQLWDEVKISSITRSFTLLYTLSLLTLFTRIQLNLLGRRNYLSSVVSMASQALQDSAINLENNDDDKTDQSYGTDFETNRKFLTFSWWLLNCGWRDVSQTVESAVKAVFGPLNPREDVSMERLSTLILDVRRKIEGATAEERRSQKWLPYLLPPPDQEGFVLRESGMLTPPATSQTSSVSFQPDSSAAAPYVPSAQLRHLLDETSDLIDSPSFSHILTLLLDTSFSHLTDQQIRSQAYKLSDPPLALDTQGAQTDPNTAKTKLATILAVMTRQAHAIGNGVPNDYIQAMDGVAELDAFAAVIYSSNFEIDGLATPSQGPAEGQRAPADAVLPPEDSKVEATASSIIDSATEMFDSVWSKATGTR